MSSTSVALPGTQCQPLSVCVYGFMSKGCVRTPPILDCLQRALFRAEGLGGDIAWWVWPMGLEGSLWLGQWGDILQASPQFPSAGTEGPPSHYSK